MTLDSFLDALPCEINGYALRITRYYDSDEQAEMWEIAYTDDKGKCMYSTTGLTLEIATLKAVPQLIDKGFRRKNCADFTNDISVNEDFKFGDWISVEEELPPLEIVGETWSTSGQVLVYTLTCSIFVAEFEFDKLTLKHYWVLSDNSEIVTHWMPLPQPPRKISPNQQQIIGTAEHIKTALSVMDKKGGEK